VRARLDEAGLRVVQTPVLSHRSAEPVTPLVRSN
jgi:hypothetical protein